MLTLQSGQVIDVVDETVRRLGEGLDYLVVREGPCDVTQAHVYLERERDGERVVAHITRVGDRIRYISDVSAWCTEEQWVLGSVIRGGAGE